MYLEINVYILDLPGDSDGKESARNERYPCSIPGSGVSPGIRNGNPLQYACLENAADRGGWRTELNKSTGSFNWKGSIKVILKQEIHSSSH